MKLQERRASTSLSMRGQTCFWANKAIRRTLSATLWTARKPMRPQERPASSFPACGTMRWSAEFAMALRSPSMRWSWHAPTTSARPSLCRAHQLRPDPLYPRDEGSRRGCAASPSVRRSSSAQMTPSYLRRGRQRGMGRRRRRAARTTASGIESGSSARTLDGGTPITEGIVTVWPRPAPDPGWQPWRRWSATSASSPAR